VSGQRCMIQSLAGLYMEQAHCMMYVRRRFKSYTSTKETNISCARMLIPHCSHARIESLYQLFSCRQAEAAAFELLYLLQTHASV
jgi:hypothetical protein